MKALSLLPTLCAATLFLSAPALRADNSAPPKPAGDPAQRAQNLKKLSENPKFIERFDVDGDGQLNEAEQAKAREAMKEQGGQFRERADKMRDEAMKRFDKNNDGKLDDAEQKEMEADLRANLDKRPELKKRLDTDGDGQVSDAEWTAGREKMRARAGERRGPAE